MGQQRQSSDANALCNCLQRELHSLRQADLQVCGPAWRQLRDWSCSFSMHLRAWSLAMQRHGVQKRGSHIEGWYLAGQAGHARSATGCAWSIVVRVAMCVPPTASGC
jgi:hypothetical protein